MFRSLIAASTLAVAPALAAAQTGLDLEALYRDLHANPELSFLESASSARMAAELEALGFEVTTGVGDTWVRAKAERDQGVIRDGVGGYGVVGVLRNGEGPTVMIRTDTDALPVPEQTGVPYASTATAVSWTGVDSAVMHACGHDIHMTSWVGTARALAGRRDDWSGTLVMIAQPAEELGLGAMAMLEDGLYTRFPTPDVNLALHVNAAMPSGTVGVVPGFALAAVDSVDVIVRGEGGHGAYPHTTRDPVVVAAHIVAALQTLVSRNIDPQRPGVVTVGAFQAGAKHNIISDEARLKLTVRSYDEETRQTLLQGIERIARAQAEAFDAPAPEVIFESDPIPATYNDPSLTERSAAAIAAAIGEGNVREMAPVMGGEDFAHFARTDEEIPGFIFWLGGVDPETMAAAAEAGEALPSLHSPRFAPDYAPTIETGVKAMTAAALAAFEGES